MGVTFAILRLFVKIPEVNDWLIMVEILLDTSAVINFKNSEEIPSCPLSVELFRIFNNAQIIELSIRLLLLYIFIHSKHGMSTISNAIQRIYIL